jgi:hypothetical protein
MRYRDLIEKSLADRLENIGSPYSDDPDFNRMIPHDIAYWEDGLVLGYFNGNYTDEREKAPSRMMEVPHALMVSGQTRVTHAGTEEYLNGKAHEKTVEADFWQGRYILLDGHHRVVADILKGKKSTLCEVRDMNPIYDWEGYLRSEESDPDLDRFDWSYVLSPRT